MILFIIYLIIDKLHIIFFVREIDVKYIFRIFSQKNSNFYEVMNIKKWKKIVISLLNWQVGIIN